MANQQQLADLQRNVTQLQQLEQNILAQQSTPHNQQQQQLQVRVQQILQQKQQLQQQIKQFQQQVEQQLAYTQHAGPQLLPPPLQQGQAGGKKEAEPEFLEDSSAITSVSASDLNFLMCADQLQGFMASPGKLRVARQCSVLTSPLLSLRWSSRWYRPLAVDQRRLRAGAGQPGPAGSAGGPASPVLGVSSHDDSSHSGREARHL